MTTTAGGTGAPSIAEMRAWSCTVRLAVTDPGVLAAAARDVKALLHKVDLLASRFRPDSVLSRCNAHPGVPVPIPRLLVDLVGAALDAAALTGGMVDPTIGVALLHHGYDRDITELSGPARAVGLTRPGASRPPVQTGSAWRDVMLDREAGLLRIPHGVRLDFGATTKAYVADHVAAGLAERYGVGVMLELGGDIAVAGSRTGGWRIRVSEREGGPGQTIAMRFGGLATSTTTVRRWRHDGRLIHHIIDPRTGEPADGPWRTASVAAPSTLAANTASTAAIVLGEQAVTWLEARNLAARLVSQDGRICLVGEWPAERNAGLRVAS